MNGSGTSAGRGRALTTPVLLLIFNRPETTRRVFERVRKVRPSRLYIAADGPRPNVGEEFDRCMAARAAATAVDWPCDVHTLFRDANLGCRVAVNSGLDWFFQEEEEGIILEDDCLPSDSFFWFCQDLLSRYRAQERVMLISGTNYVSDIFSAKNSYCFSRYFAIWGWASWRRVWKLYDPDLRDWPRRRAEQSLRSFYDQGFMRRHLRKTFDMAYERKVDTWDIQFFYSCLFNNGLAAVPTVNLISNIGSVGTHTTSDATHVFLPNAEMNTELLVHPDSIDADGRHDNALFDRMFKRSFPQALEDALRALWHAIRGRGA